MKPAEALAERGDCQVKIDEIKKRLVRSVRVQEGEQPAEDATELLAESERLFARLLELVSAINRTNSKTAFDSELTVSYAIAERDVVGKRRDFLVGIAEAGSARQDRYYKSEVRFVATVSVGKLQAEVDQLAHLPNQILLSYSLVKGSHVTPGFQLNSAYIALQHM